MVVQNWACDEAPVHGRPVNQWDTFYSSWSEDVMGTRQKMGRSCAWMLLYHVWLYEVVFMQVWNVCWTYSPSALTRSLIPSPSLPTPLPPARLTPPPLPPSFLLLPLPPPPPLSPSPLSSLSFPLVPPFLCTVCFYLYVIYSCVISRMYKV